MMKGFWQMPEETEKQTEERLAPYGRPCEDDERWLRLYSRAKNEYDHQWGRQYLSTGDRGGPLQTSGNFMRPRLSESRY